MVACRIVLKYKKKTFTVSALTDANTSTVVKHFGYSSTDTDYMPSV